MQRNVHEAQNKSYEVERKLNRILLEYIEAFDNERGRPRLIMTKLWQLMQSRDTKNLNVDKGLDEILTKQNKLDGPGQGDSGRKTKMKINDHHSSGLEPQMESILFFVSRMGLREGD